MYFSCVPYILFSLFSQIHIFSALLDRCCFLLLLFVIPVWMLLPHATCICNQIVSVVCWNVVLAKSNVKATNKQVEQCASLLMTMIHRAVVNVRQQTEMFNFFGFIVMKYCSCEYPSQAQTVSPKLSWKHHIRDNSFVWFCLQ